MKIVTSGVTYLDIDAYGGCVAYAELVRSQGLEAQAISTAPLNESITATVRSWSGELSQTYLPNQADFFTVIDVSVPEFFDTFVELNKVEVVIDHHAGYEEYWQQLIGDKADIEFIGAACTQVYEHWVRAGQLDKMSATSARLLMTGILDNTLGFRATVTTERDSAAYEAMAIIAGLPDDWPAQYFGECQTTIELQLADVIRKDTKDLSDIDLAKYHHLLPTRVGQLVVWNAQHLLDARQSDIESAMRVNDDNWLMNLVSIGEGVSYVVAKDPAVQANVAKLLDLQAFQNNHATAKRLWLRKEILKAALEAVT